MNIDDVAFYDADYCPKCLSTTFSKTHYEKETQIAESGLIIPRHEGFICICSDCSFNWLAPISQKAYYILESAEQLECIKMFLDKANVPSQDEDGKPYSYVGRIEQFAMSYAKFSRKVLEDLD